MRWPPWSRRIRPHRLVAQWPNTMAGMSLRDSLVRSRWGVLSCARRLPSGRPAAMLLVHPRDLAVIEEKLRRFDVERVLRVA